MARAVTAADQWQVRARQEWRDWALFLALVGPNLLLFGIFNYRVAPH